MINFNELQSVGLNIDRNSQGFNKSLDTIRPFKSTLQPAMKVLESAVEDKKFSNADTEDFMGIILGPLTKNIAEAKAKSLDAKYGNGNTNVTQTISMLEG